MKQFRGFIWKEFLHIFRDIRSMIILFGIPVVQILIFGYVVNNDLKNAGIAILDRSKDPVTNDMVNKILSSGYFILEKDLNSMNEIEEYFKKGKIKEVIVFEDDFEKKLERNNTADVLLIADASDANQANLVVNYTTSIIGQYLMQNRSVKQPMQIVPEVRMIFNENMESVYMFIPGIMTLILMLISAMMTSISITREKELGTMEILLVSPLKPFQIVTGKVIPYFILSFVNASVIILLGYFVFGMPMSGSIILLMAECMLFILMALSLGIMISTVSNSQQVAMMISMFALMLPTILLSGFIFPVRNMPEILQYLCHAMPPMWFIIIIKKIMIQGVGLSYVWKETLVILFMCVFFIFMSIKRFKTRLE